MDLVCVSEVDSTFKAYYAGFMRWKKLLRMVLTGVMGSFFSIGVTNRRFAPSNTFLAIRLLVGDIFPNSMRPV
jgi:hypothetical protein